MCKILLKAFETLILKTTHAAGGQLNIPAPIILTGISLDTYIYSQILCVTREIAHSTHQRPGHAQEAQRGPPSS